MIVGGVTADAGRVVNVAVLFTDLVGSTALASRLGPERAEGLRREHFSLLRDSVESSGGREVKNLGDGLMVVFDSTSAALACAVGMQQVFDARNRVDGGAARLEIRIGVSTGEADEDDDDFFGPPVVEAARLCGVSDGGQILTTELVRMLVGSRGGHGFTVLGERELKGMPEPVTVVAVDWKPLAGAEDGAVSVPLPSRLAPVSGSVFAGRAKELARAAEAWKAALDGERRVWLLAGEAGIGKTTLVSQVTGTLHRRGGSVLYGRCDEDLFVPYQPWIEALTTLVEHLPETVLAEHVVVHGGELGRIVPLLARRTGREPPTSSDPEAQRFAVAGAVEDLLRRAAARTPLLVVLDDLHWADASTVSLLRQVAAGADQARLMVIGTYRPSDIGVEHPLTGALGSLHRVDGVELVELAGLDDQELLELMEAMAGHEMGEEGLAVRDAIRAETGGNAFFATEVLRHLAESGAIAFREGRWIPSEGLTELGLPVSVRQVVGQRVARCGEATVQLLRYAAVVGRDFDLGLVAEVARMDEDDVVDHLDAAVGAAVLNNVGPDRYSFSHGLVTRTLYEELTPSRRARAHHRVAEALERRLGVDPGDRIGELAHHWSAATAPQDTTKARDYAALAGDRALDQLTPEEALRWYTQALDLDHRNGDDPDHLALLIRLGTAQRQTGNPAHRSTLLAAANAAARVHRGDLQAAAVIANHRGMASAAGGMDSDQVDAVRAALGAASAGDNAVRARLLGVLASELSYDDDHSARQAIADEAVAMARRVGDDRTLLAAQTSWISQLNVFTTDQSATLRALTDECLELATRLGDRAAVANASASSATLMLAVGDRARYDRSVDSCSDIARLVGQPFLLFRSAIANSVRAAVDGRLDESEHLAEEALRIGGEIGQPDALTWYAGIISTIRAHQGRVTELRPILEEFLDPDTTPSVRHTAECGLVGAHLEEGDVDLAWEVASRGPSQVPRSFPMEVLCLCSSALAASRAGALDAAPGLLDRLLPYRSQLECHVVTNVYNVSCSAALLAELLGRHGLADELFAEGIEVARSFRTPYHLAVGELEWGRALRVRNGSDRDPTLVRKLLSSALESACEHGFGAIQRDAEMLLAAPR